MAAPTYNPFKPQVAGRGYSEPDDPLSPGALSYVNRRLSEDKAVARRDPIDDEIKQVNERRTNIRYQKEGMKNTLNDFLEKDGADLFERDPITSKLSKNPDGSYVPKLGREVEDLRAKTQRKTGLVAGALSPSKQRGDSTDDAVAAQQRLAEIEPTFRLKQEKYDRIQAQMKRMDDADLAHQNRLAQLGQARESRYIVTPQDVENAVTQVNTSRASKGETPVSAKDLQGKGEALAAPAPDYKQGVFATLSDPTTRQPIGRSIAPEAVKQRVQEESKRRKLDPVGAAAVELSRLREDGVTHVGDRPIDDILTEMGGAEKVASVKTMETVKKLNARIAQIDSDLPNAGEKRRPVLEKERAVLAKLQQQKQGLIDQIPTVDRIQNALGALVQDFAGMGASGLESIAIAAKKLDETMPEWLRSGQDLNGPVDALQTAIWAKEIRNVAESMAPRDPRLAGEFWADGVPGALGSVAGFLAGGMAAKAAKIPAMLATGVFGAMANAPGGYHEAIEHGADKDTAYLSSLINAGVGVTEIVPVSRWLDRIDKASGGKAKKVVLDAGIEGLEEFMQEWFQTTAGNATALALYDSERDIFEGSGVAGATGGVAGIITSLVVSALPGKARGAAGTTPPPETPPPGTTPPPEPGATVPPEPTPPATPPATPPPAEPGSPVPPAPGATPTDEDPGEGVAPEQGFRFTNGEGRTIDVEAKGIEEAVGKLPKDFGAVKGMTRYDVPSEGKAATDTPAPKETAPPTGATPPIPPTSATPPAPPAPRAAPTPAPGAPTAEVPPRSRETPAPSPTPPTAPTPPPAAPIPEPATPAPTTPKPTAPAPTLPASTPAKPRVPSKAGLTPEDDEEVRKAFEGMDLLRGETDANATLEGDAADVAQSDGQQRQVPQSITSESATLTGIAGSGAPKAGAAPAPVSGKPLTPDAAAILSKIDAGGAAPVFISKRLENIASRNGVTITREMRPDDVVAALRAKGQPTSPGKVDAMRSSASGTGLAASAAAKMAPDASLAHYRNSETGQGLTEDAFAAGDAATTPAQQSQLLKWRAEAQAKFEAAAAAKDYQAAATLGSMIQFFSEAHQRATSTFEPTQRATSDGGSSVDRMEAPAEGRAPEGWQEDDIRELLERVEKGEKILVGASDMGLPTIHEQKGARHIGFGSFEAKTPEYDISFDGGGAMQRTENGKAFTIVGESRGKFPYDSDAVKAKLRGYLAAMAAPQPSAAGPTAPAKMVQKGIPAEKRPAFFALADRLLPKVMTPEDLGRELDRVLDKKGRPYSQAVWNVFASVDPALTGVHDWDAIYGKLDAEGADGATPKSDPKPEPEPERTPEPPPAPKDKSKPKTERQEIDRIASVVQLRLLTAVEGKGPGLNRAELKKIAGETTLSDKQIDEAAELGVVLAARNIANRSGTDEARFDLMVKLYEAQPNFTSKTSTSKINQAYSTPAPLAWFTSVAGKVRDARIVSEPTAGNGMLVMERGASGTLVNEIDPTRRANLEAQGFNVTAFDATSPEWARLLQGRRPDSMVMNPPFGAVKDEGDSREFPLPNPDNPSLTTTSIDQAITLNDLQYLDPNGRAVLIIGSGGGKAVNETERQNAYIAGIKQQYFYYLYKQYKVVQHLTVSGDLYQKQGAGWPVDVIVIDGKGRSKLPFPWVKAPAYINNWNELRRYIGQGQGAVADQPTGDPTPVPGAGGQPGRSDEPSEPGAPGRVPGSRGTGEGGGRGSSSGQSTGHQPGSGGTGPGSGGSGAGTGENQPGSSGGGSLPGTPADSEDRPDGPVEPTEGGMQAKYTPSSNAPQNTPALTPTNLVTPTQQALADLALKVGKIDVFVARELGYKDTAELFKYFDGTQIDALGLAIDNVARRGALINTDQTGLGKGRTAAAMIRYAVRQGKVPVFVTEKAGLYADMMRDLDDIGSGNLTPMMTDNAQSVVFEDGQGNVKRKLKTPPKGQNEKDLAEMMATGRLKGGAKVIFTTYSQIGHDVRDGFTEDKKEMARRKRRFAARPDGVRMKFLRKFAQDGMMILDEAHDAGGDSDVGWRTTQMLSGFNDEWQPLGPKAHPFGVYYLSATWAKRPENMGVYFETDMKRAVNSPEELAVIMKKGGVPLQQAVSSMLAQNGQLVRRELDFSGISFPTVMTTQREDGSIDEAKVAKEKELADSFTEPIREIVELSSGVGDLMKILNQALRAQGIVTAEGRLLAHQVSAVNFSAQVHNMVNQYLIAIKAEGIASAAIKALKAGESPVLAIYNTMESVYDDLKAGNFERNFNGLLHRYLSKATEITLKNPDGSTRKVEVDLEDLGRSFPELDRIPEGALIAARQLSRHQEVIKGIIEATDRSELPVSPIDLIRHRIEDAGFRMNEISGRGQMMDRKGQFIPRPGTGTAAQGRLLKEFNSDGKVALLLTKSGSTGISAHSSEKFRNRQKRVMVVGQLQPDINAMIQIFGRVFRKGQVNLPAYQILNTSIPAENRLAAVLSRKLASLNANTTSSAKGVTTEAGGEDFLNKYGDEVVLGFLQTHPDIVAAMPRLFPGGVLPDPEADAAALYGSGYGTGDFSRKVTGHLGIMAVDDQTKFYDHVLAEYKAKIRQLTDLGENDLIAENLPLNAETVEKRVIFQGQGDTVFDGPAYLETVKVTSTRKPLDPDEIIPLARANRDAARAEIAAYDTAAHAASAAELKDIQVKHGSKPDIADRLLAARQRNIAAVSKMRAGMRLFEKPVLVAFADGGTAIGYVTGLNIDKSKPLTPSAHSITVYLNTEKQKLDFPMSQLDRITEFTGYDWKENYRNLMNLARTRQIITGNLLAGFAASSRLSKTGGRIISYTTIDGSVLQGIMMPSAFNPKGSIAEIKTGAELLEALKKGEAVSSLGGAEFFWKDNLIEVRVAASKEKGGRYWQDQRLLTLLRGAEMKQIGKLMVGSLNAEQADAIVELFNKTLADPLSYIQGSAAGAGGPPAEVTGEMAQMDRSIDKKNATDALLELITAKVFDAKPQAKKLAEWAATFRTDVPVTVLEQWQHPAFSPGTAGFYQSQGAAKLDALGEGQFNWLGYHGIALLRGTWNNPKKWDPGHVFLHEYLHALTVRYIRAKPDSREVKMLNELATYSYEVAKKAKDDSHLQYGYSSLKKNEPSIEFITELFSNEKFQKHLARQAAPDWAIANRIKTMFEALVDAIRQLLSLGPRNILEESLRTGTQLVKSAVEYIEKGGTAPVSYMPMIDVIRKPAPIPHTSAEQRIEKEEFVGTREDKRSLGEKVSVTVGELGDYAEQEMRQKTVDSFHSLRRLETRMVGPDAQIDASASPYKNARITKGLPEQMKVLMEHSQLEYKGGSVVPKPDTKGLFQILRPLEEAGTLRLWENYVAAVRSDRLLEEGKEKNFGKIQDPVTGEWTWDKARARAQINERLALVDTHPEFETIRQEYAEFQKSLLDLAEKAGLINKDQRALWEKMDYVPFYRMTDEIDGVKGLHTRRGLANQRSGIRQLKGGPGSVAIVENMMRNAASLLNASVKNNAMRLITDFADAAHDLMVPIPYKAVPFKASVEEVLKALEKAGMDVSGLSTAEAAEFVKFWRMQAPKGKDVVSVMLEGKPKYFRVKDAPLLRSILSLGPAEHSWWMKALMQPKNMLTNLVTLDPAFMAANTVRDSFSAWVLADSPIKPGYDAAIGFVKSLRSDPSKIAMMAAGGGSGHYNAMHDVPEVRNYLRKLSPSAERSFRESVVDTAAKAWNVWKEVGRASENANRIPIYDSAIKGGNSAAEAAFQARDIMDFSLRGDSKLLGFFLDTVPFMNARIQGLYKLGRASGVGHGTGATKYLPHGKHAVYGAVITGATLALLARNWDDERYWDLPEWERDIYYHFWLGDQHVRIPKPFEVGQIFSTIPERIFEFLGKTGDGKLLGRRMLGMISDTFAMNPLPQFAKPVAERAMNLNTFTQRPIVSRGDEFKQPEQQFNVFTSETLREIAQSMPDSAPDWMRSPKTLEHFVRGYFGTIGMYILGAGDALTRAATDAPDDPAMRAGDWWVMRRFAPSGDLQETKYVEQFYELHKEVTGLVRQVKELQKSDPVQARRLEVENRDLIQFSPRTASTYDQLTGLRQQEKAIYEGASDSEEKRRRLAELATRRNQVAQRTVETSPRRSQPPVFNPFAGISR